MGLATRWIVAWAASSRATLTRLVSAVVLMRAKEKMIGPDARRIVALMADEQAIWDGAEMQFPREAVRRNVPAIDTDATITISTVGGLAYFLKLPTIARLPHVSPEALLRCPVSPGGRTGLATKARPVGSDMDWQRMIFRAAVKAVHGEFSHGRNITQTSHDSQGWAAA